MHGFRHSTEQVPDLVQAGITAGLAPRYAVHWVDKQADVSKGEGSYLQLPRLPMTAKRVTIRLGTYCGNVCGTSATWVVTRHGAHWSARSVGGVGMA